MNNAEHFLKESGPWAKTCFRKISVWLKLLVQQCFSWNSLIFIPPSKGEATSYTDLQMVLSVNPTKINLHVSEPLIMHLYSKSFKLWSLKFTLLL